LKPLAVTLPVKVGAPESWAKEAAIAGMFAMSQTFIFSVTPLVTFTKGKTSFAVVSAAEPRGN
jgi:hypothetical protein